MPAIGFPSTFIDTNQIVVSHDNSRQYRIHVHDNIVNKITVYEDVESGG